MLREGIVLVVILMLVGVSIPSTGRVVEQTSTVSSEGITLYVGGSGPGNYTSIQQAVDDSQDGDTVFVYNGTYYDNIDIINKSINVIGEDKNTTIVINDESSNRLGWTGLVFEVYASNVMIKGFSIQKGRAGIHIWGSLEGCHENIMISDCNIVNNFIDWGGIAIRTGNVNNITIKNCYFDNEGLSVRVGGNEHSNIKFSNCFFDRDPLQLTEVKYAVFNDCKFFQAGLTAEHGYTGLDYLQCYNCTMDSESGHLVDVWGSYQTFENCTFSNYTGAGIRISESDGALIRNCVFKDGRKESSKGITIASVSNALIEGCTIEDMKIGIYFVAGRNIAVKNCHITSNKIGISNFQWFIFNRFIQNNFINNEQQFYNGAWLFINIYKNNYWDDWDGTGPYHVWGFLNWDWNPASEPYDIEV